MSNKNILGLEKYENRRTRGNIKDFGDFLENKKWGDRAVIDRERDEKEKERRKKMCRCEGENENQLRERTYANACVWAWRREESKVGLVREGVRMSLGKMVYEIKKWNPFFKKCKDFLVKWKSFSVWQSFYVEVNIIKYVNHFLKIILRRSKQNLNKINYFNNNTYL